jgi:hypothetical protein
MPVEYWSKCCCPSCRKQRAELQRYVSLDFRERKAYRIANGSAPITRGHQ